MIIKTIKIRKQAENISVHEGRRIGHLELSYSFNLFEVAVMIKCQKLLYSLRVLHLEYDN